MRGGAPNGEPTVVVFVLVVIEIPLHPLGAQKGLDAVGFLEGFVDQKPEIGGEFEIELGADLARGRSAYGG